MRLIIGIVTFIIAFAIISGVLKFLFHVVDDILTFGVGAVIAIIAAVVALSFARNVSGGTTGSTGV